MMCRGEGRHAARRYGVYGVGVTLSRTQVEVVMTEGRKREVRRLLEAVGNPVVKLVRTRFGPVDLRGLKAGATRGLSPEEVGELHKLVGL